MLYLKKKWQMQHSNCVPYFKSTKENAQIFYIDYYKSIHVPFMKHITFQVVVCKHGNLHVCKPVLKTFSSALVRIDLCCHRCFLSWKGPIKCFCSTPSTWAVRQPKPKVGSGAHSLFKVGCIVLIDASVSGGRAVISFWIPWCQVH